MSGKTINRREFLRGAAVAAVGALAASCAQPTAEVIEKEVTVEKVVKETVVVEKEVPVEQVVTATPVPTKFKEAPMLADLVKAERLPPVDQRLPAEPVVIKPWKEVGKYGGTWRMVMRGTPGYTVGLHLHEAVLRRAMGGIEIIPNVAETWEVDKEGKVFTLHLVKGIRWYSGQPFTAEDIVFFMEDVVGNQELYPAYPNWLKAGAELPKVDKLDDYTLRFSYAQPAPFFTRMISEGDHLMYSPQDFMKQFHTRYTDKAQVENVAKDKGMDSWDKLFLTQDDWESNPDRPTINAWQLKTMETMYGSWERNPYYWKVDTEGNQLPYIDKLSSQVASTVETAQMMAAAGEGELQTYSTGQFPQDTMILKKNQEMGNYRVLDIAICEANAIQFALNLTCKDTVLRDIFRDKRFRIALSLAVNRDDIRKLVYLDVPIENRQVAPLPASPYYHERAAKNFTEYDPGKANALLDEMGLTKKDSEGFRLRPDGHPIEFAIEVIADRTDFVDDMEMVAEWWRAVGIKASSKAVERSLYFTRLSGNELLAGVNFAGNGLFVPVMPHYTIPITTDATWAPEWGLWYSTKGKSGEEPPAEVKKQLELYDQVMVTPDLETQQKLWSQLMDINAENCYHFGMCDRPAQPVCVSNKFHNVPDSGWMVNWEGGTIATINPCQVWKDS